MDVSGRTAHGNVPAPDCFSTLVPIVQEDDAGFLSSHVPVNRDDVDVASLGELVDVGGDVVTFGAHGLVEGHRVR